METSFRCSSCGKCCNSPPQMTVPELFHHERRFVGCLTIRRVRRIDWSLGPSIFHRLPGDYDVLLATQAFEISDRCPALADNGLCGIHHDRKPLQCVAVPLDPLLPDEAAHAVLRERAKDAAFFGADCIADGKRDGYPVIVRRLAIVDSGSRAALAARRRALAEERRAWGDAVFRMLARDLWSDAEAVARLPEDGYFAMPITPVLMALAAQSATLRARCAAYLDAQLGLIGELRGDPQLQAFARAHTALRSALS